MYVYVYIYIYIWWFHIVPYDWDDDHRYLPNVGCCAMYPGWMMGFVSFVLIRVAPPIVMISQSNDS